MRSNLEVHSLNGLTVEALDHAERSSGAAVGALTAHRRRPLKRLFDLTASLVGLIVLSPVFLVAAIAIRLESPGPVFYLQERIGRNGRAFRIIKFRSMTDGTDKDPNHVAGDPRITRVGAVLRKYKIDEFPQLVNVVLGEMSLVGPRPEVASFVAQYSPRQRRVLDVLPGITSTASIAFRNENALLSHAEDPVAMYRDVIMPKKLEMNLEYIERENLVRDIGVIFTTLASVWRPDGASVVDD